MYEKGVINMKRIFNALNDEEYLTMMLDEAIEHYNPKDNITMEQWQERMRNKYNVNI